MKGFVYLIRCQDFYKIGKTNDIKGRLVALQTGNPYPLTLVQCSETEDMDLVEECLHSMVRANKAHILRGEWYKLCDIKVEEITKWLILATDFENPPLHCGCKWSKEGIPYFNNACEIHKEK